MKIKFFPLVIIFILSTALSYAQIIIQQRPPSIIWQKTIGGSGNDSLTCLIPTRDNGYILAGQSNSKISGNKTQNAYNNSMDFWIVKLDSRGNIKWNKTIGGTGTDKAPVIIQTSDGGYLVGGTSSSDISGNKTEDAINGSYDFWVIKLDSTGAVKWNNTIGGIQLDVLVSMNEKSNGTFILGGYSYTAGERSYDKNDKNLGSSLWADYWLANLSSDGKTVLWNKVYGGSNEDVLAAMKPTHDGALILGGYSYSPGPEFDKSKDFLGNGDYWILKAKDTVKISDAVIGGSLSDYLTDVQETADLGYILGGYSNSPASFDKSENEKGVTDYWVVKLNANNVVQWDKTLGGTGEDNLTSLCQIADHGYLLGGYSESNKSSDKTYDSKGGYDYWLVKLDSTGKKAWDKTIGGTGRDKLSIIKEISKGEYIVGGTSNSPVSGDKTAGTIGNTGLNDFWVVRLSLNTRMLGAQVILPHAQGGASNALNLSSSSAVSIKKFSLQAVPNPVNGLVKLTFNSDNKTTLTLNVYDNAGKQYINTSIPPNQNTFTLDMSKYAAGSYYIVISNKTSSASRIVIKNK